MSIRTQGDKDIFFREKMKAKKKIVYIIKNVGKTRITQHILLTLHPNIRIRILQTPLDTFPMVLSRRIRITIKSFLGWRPFPLFS